MNCQICDTLNPYWSWTDTHGVAQCTTCGAPHRIYHYDGDKRVEKPPECLISAEYINDCRAYWLERKQVMPSGFSFPGGQELATPKQSEDFYRWLDDRTPKPSHVEP